MQTVSLGGEWKLKEVAEGCDVAAELDAGEWVPAVVPGCVHTDLMAADRIPDPFYRLNEGEVKWVAERDWLYVKTFDADAALLANDRVELVCDGLDTFATIVLNGREIARTENAFVEHTFDVKDALVEGANTLAVRFESSDRICAARHAEAEGLDAVKVHAFARKPQYETGWDWGPMLPNSGIWRSIQLRAFSTARIENVFAPAILADGAGRALLAVDLVRTDDAPLTVEAVLSFKGEQIGSIELDDVQGRAKGVIEVEKPQLWWPVGHGDQELYDLSLRLLNGGEELDRRELRIAFRTCELEREEDAAGESFVVKVNGRRIFCKGANWIPADSFPWRVTHEKYRRLIEMAVDQNMNMLRVWGGGIYEADVFFDLCDELGVLVWHDFMFACSDYPDDARFHDLVKDEAEKFVRRVRNHPCIALYCGNNECHWGAEEWGWGDVFHARTIFDDILPDICERLDPTRPYWPGSPFGGPKANCETHGDMHDWGVWHGGLDPAKYTESAPRFISEFGFEGFPTMDTILEFAEPEDLSADSEVMLAHQKCNGGTAKIVEASDALLGEPGSFERTVLFSQIVQGEALKTGIEHWRRSKWHTAGALVWQLNDCWPVISWATVDGGLRPKPAYYYLRRAYEPVLITAHIDGENVIVSGINDTAQVISGTLDVELFDVHGEAELLHTDGVSIPGDGACRLCSIPIDKIPELDRSRHFLWITFYSSVHESSVTYFFGPPKDVELPEPNIQVEIETDQFDAETLIRLTSAVFVKGVWLSIPGQDVRFSDNAFDLVPYVSREVTVDLPEGLRQENLQNALKILYCNRIGPGS